MLTLNVMLDTRKIVPKRLSGALFFLLRWGVCVSTCDRQSSCRTELRYTFTIPTCSSEPESTKREHLLIFHSTALLVWAHMIALPSHGLFSSHNPRPISAMRTSGLLTDHTFASVAKPIVMYLLAFVDEN